MAAGNKFTREFFITICIACFYIHSVCAQNTKSLTLEEAIGSAVSHSKQLKVDSIQLNIAKSRLTQGYNNRLPQLVVNLNYTRISDNIVPYTIAMPTGDLALNPQILNQSYNSIQLKQLLWSGGKVSYGIEAAKKEIEATRYDTEKNRIDVEYNVTSLWYNLHVLRTSKKIIEANVTLLKNKKEDLINLEKQGIVIPNDVLKLDLAMTGLESNLIDIDNSVASLNFTLCTLIGLPEGTIIELSEPASGETPILNKSGDYQAEALAGRPELKSIEARKEAALFGLKIARLNYLPTLSAIGSMNYDMPNQRIFPAQAIYKGTWYVGANLSWNISDLYFNRAKANEAEYTVNKVNALREQATEGIKIEVNQNYTSYLQTVQKIILADKQVEQAKENFRVEQNKSDAGTSTSSDFLDANTQLLQAQLNLNAAVINGKSAYKKLTKSLGKTN